MRIGLVTCGQFPELAADDRPLLAEFAARGWDAVPVVWDDPKIEWPRFDLIIIRSCWDYHLKVREFQDWIDTVEGLGLSLLNTPNAVRWNLHKSYLTDLQKRGVLTPQSERVAKGSTLDLDGLMKRRGWKDAVVKPAVSAGAWKTLRASELSLREAQESMDQLLRDRDILVQEFLPEVVESGELSMIYIGHEYSHAVLKRPRKRDFRVGEEHGGSVVPTRPRLRALLQAREILDHLSSSFLYARVDGVMRKGTFILTELELIEPELFFRHHPLGVRRFADEVAFFDV